MMWGFHTFLTPSNDPLSSEKFRKELAQPAIHAIEEFIE